MPVGLHEVAAAFQRSHRMWTGRLSVDGDNVRTSLRVVFVYHELAGIPDAVGTTCVGAERRLDLELGIDTLGGI